MNAQVVAALTAAGLDPAGTEAVVRAALEEDLRFGPDVTTEATVAAGAVATADVAARQPGVIAGVPVALAVLDVAGLPVAAAGVTCPDGTAVAPGDIVLTVTGPLRQLLTAERTLLNLMTHLSGIATATRAWVSAVAGTGAVIRDTRKTTPGLRDLEKYAVRCGGGSNHRLGLGDAALIKDNHVSAAGGIAAAVEAVRIAAPGIALETECDTLDQVREALAAGCELILLDNMSLAELRAAVALTRRFPGTRLEASGGLRLDTARAVAQTGVDYLSAGTLTHSSPALDLGLDLRTESPRARLAG
ncbi:MAG TPA: carboxylating nicotinate-nucleotide diphosphorylase [Streptosporangiaceae bacterium]|jgi:nicotinate-nucleotide pyrophosphorylase (carboxylating)